jgi:dTDP-glucose 4,6-dehydratase
MKILISGGAGFVGSHLCDLLISEGHEIICVDNLITGNIINVKHLLGNDRFEFREHDVTEPMPVEGKLDYILHLASPASPIDFDRLSLEILRVGSLGTLNLLDLAVRKKAKFLLASTSEVYGDALVNPQTEEYWGNVNPIGPRSVYDEAKRFAEASTMAYHRKQGLNTRIARIFNTYGPRMRKDDGRVVSTLIIQALTNQPLTVFGDGSQTRSFCYVSDLIAGIYKLMLSDAYHPINLGNPEEISILELARRILKITQSKSEIVRKPLPQNDPRVRRPDIEKAHMQLGWSPEVSLNEGLARTIDWFSKLST